MLLKHENWLCGRKCTLQGDEYFASDCYEPAFHSSWPNGFFENTTTTNNNNNNSAKYHEGTKLRNSKNSHIGHCTHTAERANVKVQSTSRAKLHYM